MKTNMIITALLALVALTGQAKVLKTMKEPQAMTCVNISLGELKADEVVMTDTATTVRFTLKYQKGRSFRLAKTCYLADEDGNRYALRSAENIVPAAWIKSPKNGVTTFTMHFEPMPKRVKVFDFIEDDGNGAFMLIGIHDRKTTVEIATAQSLLAVSPYTLPADWLRTDSVIIRGRIEGYDAGQFGFTAMESYPYDVTSEDNGAQMMDIAPDGSFEKRILLSYPMQLVFSPSEKAKVAIDDVYLFARPGDTVDITIRKNDRERYECVYNSGSSKDVERWLKSNLLKQPLAHSLSRFNGTLAEASQTAATTWRNMMYCLQTESHRCHFTPLETRLALAKMQTAYALAYLDYVMRHENDVIKTYWGDDGHHTDILDSAEWKAMLDPKTYAVLHDIDFDNPLILLSNDAYFLINRIQFARYVRHNKYADVPDDNGIYDYTMKNEEAILANTLDALHKIMGDNRDNLILQLCIYKDMMSDFNSWRSHEESIPDVLSDTTVAENPRLDDADSPTLSRMYPLYLATFTHPYVRQKAEQYYADKMAQAELTMPMPDTPSANLIRSLCDKYPGRYLVLDFWGMGCGPCRAAIQQSKDKRAEIAKRDDVKLVFIADERTAEGSEAYRKYVAEWLAGEETVCLNHADFRRMQELFRFSGIPHYETITPDFRRVRDDVRLNGFYNFVHELEKMKEELE